MEKGSLKYLGVLGIFVLILFLYCYLALGKGGNYNYSPHADSEYGVLRDNNFPRGDCSQCHTQHDGESPLDFGLFTENTNSLCYTGNSCHLNTPPGYPAGETDRMPEGSDYPGYFEYNSGGVKIKGVENRKRWPGQIVFENPNNWAVGKYFSPHRNDQDMPYQDANGYGLCKNCHNPHGTFNYFDMLDTTYLNIQGFQISGRPPNYQLCFECHSPEGPAEMDQENKYIADYYDQSINDDAQAGHQIQTTEGYLREGDKLP
ncbi:MAG: cytochrome c3 family protein, partial [Candidatus Zixiibacteriota bacterium]